MKSAMTDHDKAKVQEDEKPDAEEAFERTLRNLVNTPHKPHEPLKKGREPKPAPRQFTDSAGAPTNFAIRHPH